MNPAAVLLLAALAVPAGARAEDPLKSAACAAALAGLQTARGAGAATGELQGRRDAAAAACLGSAQPPSRPARVLRAPIVVPPPQVEVLVPPSALQVPAPQLPPPAVVIERAPLPAHCDAAGCWTSGGTHLRHVPPNLAWPGGLCLPHGGGVSCP